MTFVTLLEDQAGDGMGGPKKPPRSHYEGVERLWL
jgi:hypothetical protein